VARKGLLESNERKKRLVQSLKNKRTELKSLLMSKTTSLEQRFEASLKLAQLPRNSSQVRVRARCIETGRPRGVYSFSGLSRVVLREKCARGYLPGVTRSSW